VFLAAISEGGMFDWSGVYFKEVVHVELFTLGYLIFLIAMATSRFLTDKLIDKMGMQKMYIFSSLTTVFGYTISVLFPTFWPALIGFVFVGFGTASIFPMTFTLAGTSTRYSTGMAISLIATYGMIGVLAGPPIIGYIAHAFNLKVSFVFLGTAALMIVPISRLYFLQQKRKIQD
jgi:MFS family permease